MPIVDREPLFQIGLFTVATKTSKKLSIEEIRRIARAPLPAMRTESKGKSWGGATTLLHTTGEDLPNLYRSDRPGRRYIDIVADRTVLPDHWLTLTELNAILEEDENADSQPE